MTSKRITGVPIGLLLVVGLAAGQAMALEGDSEQSRFEDVKEE